MTYQNGYFDNQSALKQANFLSMINYSSEHRFAVPRAIFENRGNNGVFWYITDVFFDMEFYLIYVLCSL